MISFYLFIDGTTNFAHGYPSFAVSVGVLYRGKPAAASVVDPLYILALTSYDLLHFLFSDSLVNMISETKFHRTGRVCWWSNVLEHSNLFCNCRYNVKSLCSSNSVLYLRFV